MVREGLDFTENNDFFSMKYFCFFIVLKGSTGCRGEHIKLFPKKYLGKVSHFGQLWEEFIHFDQNI